jgi:hypothetical protein
MERSAPVSPRCCRAGDLVVLEGELGAGKTTLTRGLGAALGARGPITSPTFVLARSHPHRIRVPLVHVDAYRLSDATELDDLDLDYDHTITSSSGGRQARRRRRVLDRRAHRPADRGRPGRRGRAAQVRITASAPAGPLDADLALRRLERREARRPPSSRRLVRGSTVLLAIDTSAGTSVAVVDLDAGILAEESVADTAQPRRGHRHPDRVRAAHARVARTSSAASSAAWARAVHRARVGHRRGAGVRLGIGVPVVPIVSHDAIALGHGLPRSS